MIYVLKSIYLLRNYVLEIIDLLRKIAPPILQDPAQILLGALNGALPQCVQ